MKKILALLSISAVFFACTDDDINPEQNFADGPKIVGFTESFAQVAYFSDEGQQTHKFPLALIGSGNGQTLADDIQVSYEIDPASTAAEGVEFNFVDSSGIITIPAGSTFGEFPLLVNTASLNPTMKTELILKVTSATNNSVVGAQYDTLRIVFVGCQTSLEGLYTVVVTRNDGIVRTYTNETVDLVDTNYLKTRTTGTWAAGTIAPDQGYNFTDICGEITISQQGLCQGYYSNQVYGTAADDVDGNVVNSSEFQTNYEITFAAGNRQYNNYYTRVD